jgi:putative ABC transport system permease protein
MKLTRSLLVIVALASSLAGFSCSEPAISRSQPSSAQSEPTLVVELSFPAGTFTNAEDRSGYARRLIAAIGALPELASVAVVGTPPIQPRTVVREGFSEQAELTYAAITPAYFRALELPLISGRQFEERDGPNTPAIAILSESSARKLFPGEDPIGKRIAFSEREGRSPWITVVGVVGDAPQSPNRPRPEIYRPYSQDPDSAVELIVRIKPGSQAMVEKLKEEIRTVDNRVTVSKVQSK